MAKLYHFTAAHMIKGCLQDGLTMGCIPVSIDPPVMLPGYQWLTSNKAFQQSWCDPRYSSLPYLRNAFRITVNIPKSEKKPGGRLIKWLDFLKAAKDEKLLFAGKILNSCGDPQNWYLFRGTVKKEWFVKVSRNPDELL